MLRIYKSSAGSGKTYTLVKEYLRMALKKPGKFKHILAITFTNKAANEMKERIVSALANIKANDGSTQSLANELASELKITPVELTERAGEVLKQMLHNYSDISVSTIDSFTHRVVRSFAHDLHLSMNFEIEMDSEKLLLSAIELLMDRLNKEDDQITNAVVAFAETKIEEGKGWNIEHSLVRLAKELFNEDAFPYLEQLSEFDFAAAQEIKESLFRFIAVFEQKVFSEGEQAFQLIENNDLTAQNFYQGKNGIYNFFQNLATHKLPNLKNQHAHKSVNENKWSAPKAPREEVAAVESISPQLAAHFKKVQSIFEKEGSDYHLAKLLQRNFYSFILLAEIQKLLNDYKKENNLLHISEFQKKVHSIVKEQDAPVIYERLGDWYDNILIDEHQDTSVLQWQNLLPLIENSQFKSEDSLVVGDGKQAIYRFRNGKVEQFAMLPKIYGSDDNDLLKERETAIANYGAEVKNLEFNFRSRSEIVAFNNSLYEVWSALPELINKSIYEKQKQKQGRDALGGYIQISFLKEEEERTIIDLRCARIEKIISDVQQHGYEWSDIAVLTRNNKNGSEIASYLIGKNIPVISTESLLIDNSPQVKLLLATLGYLTDTGNHLSRAEMFYFIHLLLLHKDARFEQFDFKCAPVTFEEKISELVGKRFIGFNFLNFPLVQLVQQLQIFYGFKSSDPFVQFFTDEVMLFTSRNRNNISNFLQWWNEVKGKKSIIYPSSLNAVKVMTIHKAKGLQFPVVIMADADWGIETSKKNFWVTLNKPWLKNFHTGILSVTKAVKETEFKFLYEEEEAESFLDSLNLLYVATTRAEDMLYVLSEQPKKEPAENNSATALWIAYLKSKQLWNGFQNYEFGDNNTSKLKFTKQQQNIFATDDKTDVTDIQRHISIRKNSRFLWSEEKREKINWGNLLHETLKKIKYSSDAEKVLSKLLSAGVLTNDEKIKLEQEVRSVIQHPQLKKYFELPYTVVNERSLMTVNSIKIPDRVVFNGTDAIVIDYKTGEINKQHKEQLNEYAVELAKFGFESVRKILVYTEQKIVEEV